MSLLSRRERAWTARAASDNPSGHRWRARPSRLLVVTLAAMVSSALMGMAPVRASAPSTSTFAVVAPTAKVAGQTYSQWSARWWQWAANASAAQSPLNDATGAKCAFNQRGPVWFLAGTTGGNASRTCTVPEDTVILLPIINNECSTVEGTPMADLAWCAAAPIDAVTETSVSVDGATVDLGSPSDGRYRFVSPTYQITFAADNVFGVSPGTGSSIADGFWLMLKNLSPGAHTLDFSGACCSGGFALTVHYYLTVRD